MYLINCKTPTQIAIMTTINITITMLTIAVINLLLRIFVIDWRDILNNPKKARAMNLIDFVSTFCLLILSIVLMYLQTYNPSSVSCIIIKANVCAN